MRVGSAWVAAAAIGVGLSVSVRATEGPWQAPAQPPVIEGHGGPPPPGTTAPQAPATAPAPRPGGGGQGGAQGRFPAQQRPKGNPDVIQRGRGIFAGACGPCHGADARGGQLGGPNLLRSELALNDKAGELMYPVIKNGRPGTAMVASPLPDEDIRAVIAFVHDLQSKIGGQGNPPPGEEVKLNILVGDARAGAAYFTARCATCHSATGDLAGLATRVADPKLLQNLWVSGGRMARFGPPVPGSAAPRQRAVTTATITRAGGETITGTLLRLDDFTVTVALPDGSQRTVRRTGDVKVDVVDPLAGHRELLRVLTDADMHNVTAYLVTLK